MPTIKITNHLDGTDKMREAILYVCVASQADEAFGSVKLNKLLFYTDFQAYLRRGKSVTGQEYQKLKNGPAPRVMLPLLEQMKRDGELAIANTTFRGWRQKRPLALRDPNLSSFTADEIAEIDQVLRQFLHYTATQISNLSHDFQGWKLAKEGETIPYSSALLRHEELTDHERQWAQELDLTGVQELLAH